jgi:DDE superfamily endonuclease
MGRRGDALMDLLDALLCSGRVESLAYLSQSAASRRTWASVYAALAQGRLDAGALRAVLARYPLREGCLVFAVDASVWARVDAPTSAARGFYHHASRHSGGRPIVPGWLYSWIAEVAFTRESWTAPVEVARVPPGDNVNRAAAEQIRRLLGALADADRLGSGAAPWFLFDAGYDAVQLSLALAPELAAGRLGLLVRLRADRCLYADPHPPADAQAPGRRPVHGARLACADPTTWWAPDAELTTEDDQYGTVRVRAWSRLHSKPHEPPTHGTRAHRHPLPLVRGTLLLVEVGRLPARPQAPKPLWLWWSGTQPLEAATLDRLWRAYVRRFDLEHTFRFLKHGLNWTTPRVRTPAQADRWTWLVGVAYTLLRLARPVVAERRLPWHRALPAGALPPARVRRAFSGLLVALGTPAAAVKRTGRSPGRPKGRRSAPAPRYPVVKVGPARPRPRRTRRRRAG